MLLLGYTANRLSMLQTFLNFRDDQTPDAEVEQNAMGTQFQRLDRLIVGKLVARHASGRLSKDQLSWR